MRFLENNEIWEWCADRGIELLDRARPSPDDRLTQKARLVCTGERRGREPAFAASAVAQLGVWDEALLWITQTGIWPSTEDWPAFYAIRGRLGERRSIETAPGHLVEAAEQDVLTEFLTAAMQNGWDVFVLAVRDGHLTETRIQVSHDEWIELQSVEPVSFPLAAV